MSNKDFHIRVEKLELVMPNSTDPKVQEWITEALDLMEIVTNEREELKKENQRLKDENNRLKGEQGKPDIKANTAKKQGDHSSENERKNKKETSVDDKKTNKDKKQKRNRQSKVSRIKVDRDKICPIDKDSLPADATFKGYSDSIVQDIKIITDNVRYRREVYYSASMKKSYYGDLPSDVAGQGEYGVGVRSLLPLFKSECHLSEKSMLSFFHNFGIIISPGYISNQWTKGYDFLHQEKSDIYQTGLKKGSYHQIDDTGARVKGKNHYTHIICNSSYAAFFTTPRKDRLTVLDIFKNFTPREFMYNSTAIDILKSFRLSKKVRRSLDSVLENQKIYDDASFDKLLNDIPMKVGPNQRIRIKEACAIAAYWKQTDVPIIDQLICDDAPQFKQLTKHLGLCWIHDGRHYKKLNPLFNYHQQIVDDFLKKYWDYYHQLLDYKKAPNPEKSIRLAKDFDELFDTQTDYEQLNNRIAKTLAKREELLLALKYPKLPLHNNASELAARVQARYRDVSLHTMSEKGTKIKDAIMTVSQTAKKLGVRTYEYLYDRVSGQYNMPSLAQLIEENSSDYVPVI
jgi:hypothetical protein